MAKFKYEGIPKPSQKQRHQHSQQQQQYYTSYDSPERRRNPYQSHSSSNRQWSPEDDLRQQNKRVNNIAEEQIPPVQLSNTSNLVEYVFGKKFDEGRMKYLVKWQNSSNNSSNFESIDAIKSHSSSIQGFERKMSHLIFKIALLPATRQTLSVQRVSEQQQPIQQPLQQQQQQQPQLQQQQQLLPPGQPIPQRSIKIVRTTKSAALNNTSKTTENAIVDVTDLDSRNALSKENKNVDTDDITFQPKLNIKKLAEHTLVIASTAPKRLCFEEEEDSQPQCIQGNKSQKIFTKVPSQLPTAAQQKTPSNSQYLQSEAKEFNDVSIQKVPSSYVNVLLPQQKIPSSLQPTLGVNELLARTNDTLEIINSELKAASQTDSASILSIPQQMKTNSSVNNLIQSSHDIVKIPSTSTSICEQQSSSQQLQSPSANRIQQEQQYKTPSSIHEQLVPTKTVSSSSTTHQANSALNPRTPSAHSNTQLEPQQQLDQVQLPSIPSSKTPSVSQQHLTKVASSMSLSSTKATISSSPPLTAEITTNTLEGDSFSRDIKDRNNIVSFENATYEFDQQFNEITSNIPQPASAAMEIETPFEIQTVNLPQNNIYVQKEKQPEYFSGGAIVFNTQQSIGSFTNGDIPVRITNHIPYTLIKKALGQNQETSSAIYFKVDFQKRQIGGTPSSSYVAYSELATKYPRILLDYYSTFSILMDPLAATASIQKGQKQSDQQKKNSSQLQQLQNSSRQPTVALKS